MTYATYGEWDLPRVIEISLKSALKPAKPVIGLPFGFLLCGDGNVYHLPRKAHRSRSQPLKSDSILELQFNKSNLFGHGRVHGAGRIRAWLTVSCVSLVN